MKGVFRSQFVEIEESGDDNSTTDENDEAAGGSIVPLSGNWSFSFDTIDASSGCPPGMDAALSSATPIETSYVEFNGAFNLQAMMENTGMEELGMNITYGNPEPNVYTMEFSQEGVVLNWKMTLESPSLMTGEYSVDMGSTGMDCTLSMTYNIALED